MHTWGQNLMEHPHLHCIVTGGGLSPDGESWVSCRKGFLLPVKVMSALFRGKFLDLLKDCFQKGVLIFPGISHLQNDFSVFLKRLYDKKWIVYCKNSFAGAEGVIKYLGRYTHRIAISNNRIRASQNGHVPFLWRDYADDNRQKTMTLKTDEFIRRFLLHVLPPRYVRIRHFGLLANRNRKNNIALSRKILAEKTVPKENIKKETWQEQLLRITGIDVTICPVCQKGKMHRIEILSPHRCNGPSALLKGVLWAK
jgi:hypothetical protein